MPDLQTCAEWSFFGQNNLGLVAAGVLAKKINGTADINARLISAGGSVDIEKALSDCNSR